MHIIVQGQSMRLVGLPLKEGDRARNVRVMGNDLSPVLPLAQSHGKIRLFLTVPSVDLSPCSAVIRTFSEMLATLNGSVASFLISADLPFAQVRWQTAADIDNITLLSDYRDMDFARNWGLLIQDLGLLACAVFVVNSSGIVTYREIVSELTAEPDYNTAIAALAAEITRSSASL
ncbi:MAG: thiol peroxidase [Oculatellaceae cyanobacterium bins.114]|nr:thiol peroxidase [Oculatellaceae cyanobacterium bins.114]